MNSPCAVNLHNAVTVSQPRLGKREAQLTSARTNEVCAAIPLSLDCNASQLLGMLRLSPKLSLYLRNDLTAPGRGSSLHCGCAMHLPAA
jgi:hypothetical protein